MAKLWDIPPGVQFKLILSCDRSTQPTQLPPQPEHLTMKSALLRRRHRRAKGVGQSKVTAQQEESSDQQVPEPIQTTAIRPDQSLSLVEIFLHSAIASVLFSRELIRHGSPAYSTRCVADLLDASGPVTYKKLLKPNTLTGSDDSQTFKILVKGRSEKADKILKLLVCVYSLA